MTYDVLIDELGFTFAAIFIIIIGKHGRAPNLFLERKTKVSPRTASFYFEYI